MKSSITLAILSIMATLSAPVSASATTVRDLLGYCEGGDSGAKGVCVGMVMGVSSVMVANCGSHRNGNGNLSSSAADPKGTSYEAMIQAFQNWARDNPQEWDKPAFFGVVVTLRGLFPCV